MEDYENIKTNFEEMSKRRRRNKLDALLRSYYWSGGLLAVGSLVYLAVTLLPYRIGPEQQFALIMAGVGLTLAVLSKAYSSFIRDREKQEHDRVEELAKVSEFLYEWSHFELVSKELVRNQGQGTNLHSLRSIIAKLYNDGVISSTEVSALEQALQTRNEIVHGKSGFPVALAEGNLKLLSIVTRKIADLVAQGPQSKSPSA